MKYLTLTLEDELSLMDRYSLSANELLVLRLLLLLQGDNQEALFQQLLTTCKHINLSVSEVLRKLQEKEIILKSYTLPTSGEFNPYIIPINKNVVKTLYRSSFELGKELFNEYPQFGNINGSIVPLRTVAKHYDSLEQAYFKYGKAINFNSDKHNIIIELVKWGRENNIINCSLSSFIINNGWIDLEALKNGDSVNINYDAVRIL